MEPCAATLKQPYMKQQAKSLRVITELTNDTLWPAHVNPLKPVDEEAASSFWPSGFSSSAINAGIRYVDRNDMLLLLADAPVSTAALFTRNRCVAAPVSVSKQHIQAASAMMRALVCNSGIANAATGTEGEQDAESMAAALAGLLDIPANQVMVASTGVIGQRLPMEQIRAGISRLPGACESSLAIDAAGAIMTTDTFPKFIAVDVLLSSGPIRISGIAKGSGMIAPDMATMLAFLATDANIAPDALHKALVRANQKSFNAIIVDGDTSTNDMVSIMASGKGGCIDETSDDFELFVAALESLMAFLAKLIVIDGEGASKLVEITVIGASDDNDAELAARTIAQSSLVKTAIHGEDANWGRIIAAAGRSGALFNQEDLELHFNDLSILKPGFVIDFKEEEAAEIMAKSSYSITLKLGNGPGSATIWSCDLSKEYVEINGSYRS